MQWWFLAHENLSLQNVCAQFRIRLCVVQNLTTWFLEISKNISQPIAAFLSVKLWQSHFSVNQPADPLLKFIKSKISGSYGSRRRQNIKCFCASQMWIPSLKSVLHVQKDQSKRPAKFIGIPRTRNHLVVDFFDFTQGSRSLRNWL